MARHTQGLAPTLEKRVGAKLSKLSKQLAFAGGVVLCLAALASVISIVGRSLISIGLGPIPGIYEIVQLACAVAIFSFLPYVQISRGQVAVDFLVNNFSERIRAFLGLVGDVAILCAAIVIAQQLWKGFGERFPHGSEQVRSVFFLGDKPFYVETTFILQMPIWYGYALSAIGAAFFCVVSAYTVWRALNWTLRGQEDAIA